MVLFERAHHWLDRLTTLPGLRQACAIRYERRFAGNRRENLFRGVYDSFEAAAATAPAARPLGYDNPDSALMYRDRIQRVYPSDYPVLFWLQWLFAQGCTHVFELGGHIGISYYAYQTVMSYPDALRWVVSDVPAVMERGTAFARNKDGLGKLSFDANFSHAAEADVLMALGVLQYLPEPWRSDSLACRACRPISSSTSPPCTQSAAISRCRASAPRFAPIGSTCCNGSSMDSRLWAIPFAMPGSIRRSLVKSPSIPSTVFATTTASICAAMMPMALQARGIALTDESSSLYSYRLLFAESLARTGGFAGSGLKRRASACKSGIWSGSSVG